MKLRLSWGIGVALTYSAFATATLGVVIFALERPVDLVSPDYYAQSLRQDRQMGAVKNAQDLHGAASVVQTGDREVVVSLPAAQATQAHGAITLYRASDASADRNLMLRIDPNGRQRISLDGMQTGLWSVQVRWAAQGRDFYLEQRVMIR